MIIKNTDFITNWQASNNCPTFKKLQVFYTCGIYSEQWNRHAE